MNVKAEAVRRIIEKLQHELTQDAWALKKNRAQINSLAKEQQILKKKLVQTRDLMRSIHPKEDRTP